jgi:hypothetical protein
MKKLILNQESHQYTLDGKNIPSVSDGLNHIYGAPPDCKNVRYGLKRGSWVHMACRMEYMGVLDHKELTDEQKNYIQVYNWFEDEHLGFNCIWEVPRYHKQYEYGFTPDIIDPDNRVIWDIKLSSKTVPTPQLMERYKMQMNAYCQGVKSWDRRAYKLMLVFLSEHSYRPVEVDIDPQLFRRFLGALDEIKGGLK